MKSDPTEIGITRSIARHLPRSTKPHAHPGTDGQPNEKASPAATDEVFAMLARNVERMQQSHARVSTADNQNVADGTPAVPPHVGAPIHVGTIPSLPRSPQRPSIDPSSFRSLDAEMDRQRERLAQLLRDIDDATAAD